MSKVQDLEYYTIEIRVQNSVEPAAQRPDGKQPVEVEPAKPPVEVPEQPVPEEPVRRAIILPRKASLPPNTCRQEHLDLIWEDTLDASLGESDLSQLHITPL